MADSGNLNSKPPNISHQFRGLGSYISSVGGGGGGGASLAVLVTRQAERMLHAGIVYLQGI